MPSTVGMLVAAIAGFPNTFAMVDVSKEERKGCSTGDTLLDVTLHHSLSPDHVDLMQGNSKQPINYSFAKQFYLTPQNLIPHEIVKYVVSLNKNKS